MATNHELQRLLREADPIAREGGLSPEVAQAIRRAALDAVVQRAPAPSWVPGPFLVAATVAATVVAGLAFGQRVRPRDVLVPDGPASARAATGKRQLQFATPGGTRIIWVFDPEFNP